MNSWAKHTPEERARRCAAISAGKFKGAAKRKIPCKVCGKPMPPYRKYCSKPCQHADIASWVKGPPRLPRGVCPMCGKEACGPHREYCSRECAVADPKFREIHLPHLLRGQQTSAQPEIREQAAKKMRGRPQIALLTAKGPQNAHAREFSLRSPDGIIYRGRNVRDFVRTHEDLFDPEDVIWRRRARKSPSRVTGVRRQFESCHASKGLGSLFGVSEHVRFSWKGWSRDFKDVTLYRQWRISAESKKGPPNMKKQWIKEAIHPSKVGSLRKSLGAKEGEKIPAKKLAAAAKKGGVTGQRARLAVTLKKMH